MRASGHRALPSSVREPVPQTRKHAHFPKVPAHKRLTSNRYRGTRPLYKLPAHNHAPHHLGPPLSSRAPAATERFLPRCENLWKPASGPIPRSTNTPSSQSPRPRNCLHPIAIKDTPTTSKSPPSTTPPHQTTPLPASGRRSRIGFRFSARPRRRKRRRLQAGPLRAAPRAGDSSAGAGRRCGSGKLR